MAAAHLSVRPRPLASCGGGQRQLRVLLRAAYRRPGLPADDLVRQVTAGSGNGTRRLLARAGVAPDTPAAGLTARQWHALVLLLAEGRSRRAGRDAWRPG